jgi:hypothetical protein
VSGSPRSAGTPLDGQCHGRDGNVVTFAQGVASRADCGGPAFADCGLPIAIVIILFLRLAALAPAGAALVSEQLEQVVVAVAADDELCSVAELGVDEFV